MKIEEGFIFEMDTCDEIQMDLNGNTKRINPHKETYTIEKITKDGKCYLWNLTKGKKSYAIDKEILELELKRNIIKEVSK